MIEEDLIAALKNKDFEVVPSLAKQLGQQTLLSLQTAPNAEVRAEIYEHSIAIINDALHLARVMRSHIGSELHANSASFLYKDSDLIQHRWQIKA